MKKKLPITVIIPCYNSNDTILRAVQSIVSQTFLPSEVIIVDDSSLDANETKKYLIKVENLLTKINIRVKIIYNLINKGPGASRNYGWTEAQERYIAFLDSDDSWISNKLIVQFDFMEKNKNFDLSCHNS